MKPFGNRELATLSHSVRRGVCGNWPSAGRALAKALPPSSAANMGAAKGGRDGFHPVKTFLDVPQIDSELTDCSRKSPEASRALRGRNLHSRVLTIGVL
jgi:hypothetical protein